MSPRWLLALIAGMLTVEPVMRAQPRPLLAVEIRAARVEFRVGDELAILFVVTNAGNGVYEYQDRTYDRSGRMPEYALHAVDEGGAAMPDPRTTSHVPQGYIGGGLGTISHLGPGERLSKTIALNLWAVVTAPGDYTVRGLYAPFNGETVASAPITVRVLPRSEEEMGSYVEALADELRRADRSEARTRLIQRLMFTGDRHAVRPLLDLTDPDTNIAFWIGEAFSYYLPKDADVLDDVVNAIRRQGLMPSSVRVLEQLDAPRQTITDLVGDALVSANAVAHAEAALAAQRYPDDRFMPRLIDLALTGPAATRARAIHAVAANRTSDGVATLRGLLQDHDPVIRATTERAIVSAYRMASTAPGRPLLPDDFPDVVRALIPPRHP